MRSPRFSRIVLVVVATCFLSCQMVQTATQAASTVANAASSGSERSGIDSQGTLQTILSAILTGVREIFQERQRMNQWIIATLEPLAYADHALNVSIPAALDLVCSSPGPDDLAPPGSELQLPMEESDDDVIRLFVGGDLAMSADDVDNRVPVEAVIEASPTSDASLTIRGGGGLLCALFSSELYVDGEPLQLTQEEAGALEPTLEVRMWPEESEVEESVLDQDDDELPSVEVTLQFSLPVEVLVALIEAEELTFWRGDIAVIEINPATSETTAQLYEHLVGPEESEETEIPPELIEQLNRSGRGEDDGSP